MKLSPLERALAISICAVHGYNDQLSSIYDAEGVLVLDSDKNQKNFEIRLVGDQIVNRRVSE